MSKEILVVGGAGYIGSHVVKLLSEKGYSPVVFDNLSTGPKQAVLDVKLIQGDLADTSKLNELFQNHNFIGVMNFAGSIVVPESVANPVKYYQNNTTNALNLINACIENSVPNFIFSSTAAVYGDVEGGVVTEETPTLPLNPYGHSKLMVEQILKDISLAHNFNYVALRYFNVSGADPEGKIGQAFPGATHLIKVCCEAAAGKRDGVKVFGTDYPTTDGTGVRDYIHVTDLAAAHISALEYLINNSKSQVLNCGYGQGYSVKEVIAAVKQTSGNDFTVVESPRRPGDSAEVVANCDKIKQILGWIPQYNSLKTIVKTAYDWENSEIFNNWNV